MFNYVRFKGSILLILVLVLVTGQGLAAAEAGEYLKYQEPQPTTSSWLSTTSYIISLLITFAVVLGLAYLTSRFLAKKMTGIRENPNSKIYTSLPLGPNRAIHVVEIAGKFLVLGVTEQNITLLSEITSLSEIEQLKSMNDASVSPEPFSNIFQRQIVSLKNMQNNFPLVFGLDTPEIREKEFQNDSRKR